MAEASRPVSHEDWNPAHELVVATEHLGFVREKLGSRIRREEHSAWLGLSRLELATDRAAGDLKTMINHSRAARDVSVGLTAEAKARGSAVGIDLVGRDQMAKVLTGLRALAVVEHGGWMPTLGRNRLVGLPGSGELAVTNKTSYGAAGAAGGGGGRKSVDNKTSYGSPGAAGGGGGREGVDNKTSYGGNGAPRSIAGRGWAPPPPRATGPGAGVRIGIVDTRLYPHPWLADGWSARAIDLAVDEVPREVAAGHGTFVAGLILSQAPGATLVMRHGLGPNGQGTTWEVAAAIGELSRSGVSVINLSFACYTDDGQPPLVLERAADRVDTDVVVVAAAGNHAGLGRGKGAKARRNARYAALPAWPAALDDVLAVGSLDRQGRTADFSPDRPWVDAEVRGVDLRSTFVPQIRAKGGTLTYEQGWAQWSGTSFSAALVSGAIAAGVDLGQVPPREAAADLLASGSRRNRRGKKLPPSAPARLAVRTAGWARGSRATSG